RGLWKSTGRVKSSGSIRTIRNRYAPVVVSVFHLGKLALAAGRLQTPFCLLFENQCHEPTQFRLIARLCSRLRASRHESARTRRRRAAIGGTDATRGPLGD